MSKSIVLCTDGTWDGAVGEPPSNVLKLFNALDGNLTIGTPASPEQERRAEDAEDSVTQVAKYLHGVGDSRNPLAAALGGGLGMGLLARVLRGYSFLSRSYMPGDKIFLVGFSRGAYTARALGELIAGVGLLDWGALNLNRGRADEVGYKFAAAAWYDYQKRRLTGTALHETRWKVLETFYTDLGLLLPALQEPTPRYLPDVKIEAVAVWDTVGSLGIPVLSKDDETRLDLLRLVHTSLGAHVKNALHAIAADEQRVDFSPTLWDPDPRVVQRFFPGSHGDVGGGYPLGVDSSLSDLALVWMAQKLAGLGVQFASDPPITTQASPLGPLHLPWTGPPYDIRPVAPRIFPDYTEGGQATTVDDAIVARLAQRSPIVRATTPPVTRNVPYVPLALVNSGHLDVSGLKVRS
jgi:uncharacterized protein (DUF2235 family)